MALTNTWPQPGDASAPIAARAKWKAPAILSVTVVTPCGLLCLSGQCHCSLDGLCYPNASDCTGSGGTCI